MNPDQFDSQIKRLRNNYGDRQYTSEMVSLLYAAYCNMHIADFTSIVSEAIATRAVNKPPMRDDFAAIADSLGLEAKRKDAWKYICVADCLRCNGTGFFWIKSIDDRLATRCCNDCFAGKNLQQAPKGTIKEHRIPTGWAYLEPGHVHKHSELHPELQRRFGSWSGLETAIRERRMSTTGLLSNYIQTRGGGVKKAPSNTDNPHHDKDLKF